MYFPYLRGRQYELLALRELIGNNRLSDKIIPVIEPVKITSTLLSTIKAFTDNNKKLVVISNPKVGTFITDSKKSKNAYISKALFQAIDDTNIYSGVIVDDNIQDTVKHLSDKGVRYSQLVALCLRGDSIDSWKSVFINNSPIYNIIPYSPSFRHIRKGRVMLDDKFVKLPRNSDYLNCADEFFSDDHIFYKDDGYKGFSDYSIVGKEYSDSGFAPYAVAIHIVYPASISDETLRIHHFVSDSNFGIEDPANKFYEALTKLVIWNKKKKLDTLAIKEFERMYDSETYPGLGVIKKLSIMHHLEWMGNYLDGVSK